MSTWTIYLLRDPASPGMGYVGQTVRTVSRRVAQHLAKARRGDHLAVSRWLAGVLDQGRTPSVTVLATASTPSMANELERSWIRWTRKGLRLVLLNRTCGGQGRFDVEVHSQAVKLALAASPETRARMGEAMARRWADPEMRARMIAKLRVVRSNPAAREEFSAAAKARWSNPDFKARMCKKNAEVASTPEARARRSAQLRETHARPEVREKIRLAALRRWADPAFRAKMRQARGC